MFVISTERIVSLVYRNTDLSLCELDIPSSQETSSC